ncbi:DUF2064 domain-containing protein [Wenzhouxiangella sp. XN201]|uniref:TIGR04282 family arsenosugar biosynthesis glycosyltransferase n=1 Tax=Wenzhouxiangella sp. XN201 TaxID=2710755 RepID=UPI0013CD4C61|nr:DUF2064 domain-containing protein [Wenzhouxiangella sp. XN201]NEZ05149.1 DUF2064 domain-containing protein [Wenzhouxiangella sp. XN201]
MSAIAIFVKTPGRSPVKTRLARTIGPGRAESLYRRCAAAVAEVAGIAAEHVYWALAEQPGDVASEWPGLAHLEQGQGSLGERMHRVFSELVTRHGSGFLLGADTPQLDPAELVRAAAWLDTDRPRHVIGPARDGGFWSIGGNHVTAMQQWTRVPYSRVDTLFEFRRSLGNESEWLELTNLTDLDTQEDMERVATELRSLNQPLPSQIALAQALEARVGDGPLPDPLNPEP